jgi:hypothetical protein
MSMTNIVFYRNSYFVREFWQQEGKHMTISQRADSQRTVRRQSAFSEIREAARDDGLRSAASMTGLFAFATVLVTAALGSGWN